MELNVYLNKYVISHSQSISYFIPLKTLLSPIFFCHSPCTYLAHISFATINDHMANKKAVQSGNKDDVIEIVNELNPDIFMRHAAPSDLSMFSADVVWCL